MAHAPDTDRCTISVALVEDDPQLRAWLESGVRSTAQLELVASFDALKPALAWFAHNDTDVLLTDLNC